MEWDDCEPDLEFDVVQDQGDNGNEDAEEFDWEDAEIGQEACGEPVSSSQHQGDIVVEFPAEKGNEIEPAAVQIGKKRKKPELYSDVRLTGPVSGDCGDRPCTELAMLVNQWANAQCIKEGAMRLLSPEMKPPVDGWDTVDGIRRLMTWLCVVMEKGIYPNKCAADDEGGAGSPPDHLLRVFEDRRATEHEMLQVFLALCRALGIHARYVTCLDPISPHPKNALAHRDANLAAHSPSWAEVFVQMVAAYPIPHIRDDNGNHNKQLADAKEWFPSSGGKGKGRRKLTESSLNSETTAKTAVKTVKSKMRWVHVDIVKGIVDKPETVLYQRRLRRHPMPYVVGIDEQGRARDVTRRYHSSGNKWAGVLSTRGRHMQPKKDGSDWFAAVLRQCNFGRGRNLEEDYEELCGDSELMPTTLQGFTHSTAFVLHDQLKKDEALLAKAVPCGIFRGRKVYHRCDVTAVKTPMQWRREGRQIKRTEVDKPLTMRKLKEGDTRAEVPLFSESQTEMMVRPTLTADGNIPTNKYGNIELWGGNDYFVPQCCTWIRDTPHLLKVAKELGVECVPAIVGFRKSGYMKVAPILDGFVTKEDQKDLLVDAWRAWMDNRERVASAKIERKVLTRWKKLIKFLVTRENLREEFHSTEFNSL